MHNSKIPLDLNVTPILNRQSKMTRIQALLPTIAYLWLGDIEITLLTILLSEKQFIWNYRSKEYLGKWHARIWRICCNKCYFPHGYLEINKSHQSSVGICRWLSCFYFVAFAKALSVNRGTSFGVAYTLCGWSWWQTSIFCQMISLVLKLKICGVFLSGTICLVPVHSFQGASFFCLVYNQRIN